MTDVAHGSLGSHAIVGAQLPIGVGAAWASRILGRDSVTVCFFGDGATNIGAFHEAVNLAAIWRLPVVFVCENNQYMEYTAIADVIPVDRPAAGRAAAYGLDPIVLDGNDVVLVHEAAKEAIEKCRRGDGPVMIEADTYRHGGHSRHDDGKYRPEAEVAAWLKRDPIPRHRERMLAAGVPQSKLDRIDDDAREIIERAVNEARAAAPADPASSTDNVWVEEEVSQWV